MVTLWPGAASYRPVSVSRETTGGIRSATGRITWALVELFPAASTATASRVTFWVGKAEGETVKVKVAATDACGGDMIRVSECTVAPLASKLTEATPPRSVASTTAVITSPGLTRSPVVSPAKRTTGLVASSTVISMDSAWPVRPLVSTADARRVMTEPGTASIGT